MLLFIATLSLLANNVAEKDYTRMREEMVQTQIAGRDVTDPDVLAAMRAVPRHLFVEQGYQKEAYGDYPLPIGEGQTISQPYIVAKMTELAKVRKGIKVLEIGTGSGYQAAVLAQLGAEVYSIEIVEALAKIAKKNLEASGYRSVHLRTGDGYKGWPEMAPFDAILVTAAPEEVPTPLIEQLKIDGRLVIPVGKRHLLGGGQELLLMTKTAKGLTKQSIFPVAFVPMTGEAQKKR